MKLRNVIFWLHLAVGLIAGIVILSMAISGSMLAFERQAIEWAERGYRCSVPANAIALSPEAILGKTQAAYPDLAIDGLTLRSQPSAPAMVSAGRETVILVNPYTGDAMGQGAVRTRSFFRWLTEWHRWFALQGASRETGKAVTGACSLCFLGLVVSGLWLWFPRRWTRKTLAAVSLPNLALRGKARDFNWHNAVGLWCAPLLLVTTLTGTIMAYPWANDLPFRATGNEPPPRKTEVASGEGRGSNPGREGERKGHESRAPRARWAGLDPLWVRAEQQVAGWRSISLRFGGGPGGAGRGMVFTIDAGNGGRPDLRAQLTLDPRTGDVLKWEPFSSYNRGRQLRMWARFTHTGEAGGWFGQMLALTAALGAITLVWTGFALAARRFIRLSPQPAEYAPDNRNVVVSTAPIEAVAVETQSADKE